MYSVGNMLYCRTMCFCHGKFQLLLCLSSLATIGQQVTVGETEVMTSLDLDTFTDLEHVIAVLYVAVIAEAVFIHQECI